MKLRVAFIFALVADISSAQASLKSVDHIISAVLPKNGSARLEPLFHPPSNSTPKYNKINELNIESLLTPRAISIVERQSAPTGDGTCAPGRPCSNGACCSKSGYCGYSPDFCSSSNCISNCDAKAQCGQYAPAGKQKCPLNVCCSQYGFCGTTEKFCGTGCDNTGGLCGKAPPPSGASTALFRSIGYYESWATTRSCDKIAPEDLDTTGLTHLNFAFAFFHPTTFQMTAMDSNAQRLLKRFTALKSNRLQTWISVGGWSFNDPGNNPDTRAAFSDMASTAANRKTFIESLLAFMRNYGFDGVDIDWEYPVADDRGGKEYDRANFVSLVREMKAAFAGRYGISVTLPSSYWYLQHFDLGGMQPHVSFFNVMSYDLHGVWDSSNRYTGSFIRPHTNLTEIDDAMNLLWRAGVKASNVVLGLGFYGRSFTLTDTACTKPETCKFSSGAKAGECSAASGILTSAEIGRIITKYSLTPVKDTKAAVKWISWDTNQWVSYDDEETFVIKLEYARSLGLSGTMVWALDQGVFSSTQSSSTLAQYNGMALLERKGVTKADIATYQVYQDAGDSCYTSFCNVDCAPGYFSVYQMNGQVGQLGAGSACKKGELQNLCCKSGTFLGRCRWDGYRGVGLSCYGGGGCRTGETLMAVNSNHYFANSQVTYKEDVTCNGGVQSFCCNRFKPSTELGRGDAALLQTDSVDNDPNSIAKRDLKSCAITAAIAGGSLAFIPAVGQLTGLLIAGAGVLVCFAHENEAAARKLSGYSGPLTRGKINAAAALVPGALPPPVVQPPKGQPQTSQPNGQKVYGDYPLSNLTGKITCTTTYTCRYGKGFDQVCDNQRYALEKITTPNYVFTYDEFGNGNGRTVSRWAPNKNAAYRQSFGRPATGRNRCETDEFPMNSLVESTAFAQQALRSLDGNENGAQGNDFNFWLLATWRPCSTLLQAPPPITWAVPTTGLPAADPRRASATGKVIAKYGFDSSSGRDPCWATFTPASGASSVVRDHGFRVHTDDPLFSAGINWAFQNYRPDPNGLQAAARPTNVASAAFLKREEEAFSTWTTKVGVKTKEPVLTTTDVFDTGRGGVATLATAIQTAVAS